MKICPIYTIALLISQDNVLTEVEDNLHARWHDEPWSDKDLSVCDTVTRLQYIYLKKMFDKADSVTEIFQYNITRKGSEKSLSKWQFIDLLHNI